MTSRTLTSLNEECDDDMLTSLKKPRFKPTNKHLQELEAILKNENFLKIQQNIGYDIQGMNR